MTDPALEPERDAAGIWRLLSRSGIPEASGVCVPPSAQISLGEGGTPLEEKPEMAAEIGLERLWLKREDLNPTGSHKDRGAAFQVSAWQSGRESEARASDWVAISSSGNAAIAAATYAALTPMKLVVFMAPGTPAERVLQVLDQGAHVVLSHRAISLCSSFAKRAVVPNLRPSTDPNAVIGFMTLGWELCEQTTDADSVFIYASSGASLVAIGRAMESAESGDSRQPAFALHVVQGTHAHPIAVHFDDREVPTGTGRVGANGARKTRRLGEAVRSIKRTGGSGWIVTDDEALAARRLLESTGIHVALESAAALAGAQRAARDGAVRKAIVVLTGERRRPSVSVRPGKTIDSSGHPRLHSAETIEDVEMVLGIQA